MADKPALLYFTPEEAGTNAIEFIKHKALGDGMKWMTPKMNRYILPLDVGMMATICSIPGSGKTTNGVALARNYARELIEAGKTDKSVLYITLDQPIENIAVMAMASREHTVTDFHEGKITEKESLKLKKQFTELPLYIFGKSIIDQRPSQPRFTYKNIEIGIRAMEKDAHTTPALIVIDYVQIMPIDGQKGRTEQVTESVYRARELCLGLKVPILLLAQATRESVKERKIKIPIPQDSQHSSAIEQASDVWIGLWRPKVTELDIRSIELLGQSIPVTDNLVIAGLMKQWKKTAGVTFVLHCSGGTLEVADMEIET